MAFIITLTGPSQSGKSLILDKIEKSVSAKLKAANVLFQPERIKKYTTRALRIEEIDALKNNKSIDVQPVDAIPSCCNLVYQTYGVRYGLDTQVLEDCLLNGKSPIVVLNDIRAVEVLKKEFPGKVLSLFLFRKIPELDDFKKGAANRGNVSESEIYARYEKAVAIYRTFIENIALFDKVILNAIEYCNTKINSNNTIVDKQLYNSIKGVCSGIIKLKNSWQKDHSARIFVISGNAASGKDEIIRAVETMGQLQSKVLSKFTMREQEPDDGEEMICRYVPKKNIITGLASECDEESRTADSELQKLDEKFKDKYKKEFVAFQQKVHARNENGTERFWRIVQSLMDKKKGEAEDNQQIIRQYFELNELYCNNDLEKIVKDGKLKFENGNARLFSFNDRDYIVYGKPNKWYGCDVTNLSQDLSMHKKHVVLVASDLGVVELLKWFLGDPDKVKLIYAHSGITVKEFKQKAKDSTKNEKAIGFDKELYKYVENISLYDHVTIYAQSALTYEKTIKEEELIDQMFRLFRAY